MLLGADHSPLGNANLIRTYHVLRHKGLFLYVDDPNARPKTTFALIDHKHTVKTATINHSPSLSANPE